MSRHWRCPAVTSAYSVMMWLLAFFLTMLWFRLFLRSVDGGSFWVHNRRFLLYVARWHFKNWHVLYSIMLNIWKLISCMTFSYSYETLWAPRCGRTLNRIRHHLAQMAWLRRPTSLCHGRPLVYYCSVGTLAVKGRLSFFSLNGLEQWFSPLLMLWPFNIVTPNHVMRLLL